jgi:hypothetical protein
MRSGKITLTFGVLALGTALTALPALAQDYHMGRAANDGGAVASQNQGQNTGSRSNEQSGGPMGNTYAFGSQGQPQGQAQGRGLYNSASPAQTQFKYSVGRSANDGGQVKAQLDQGQPTSGSAANREAKNSARDTYRFGAQGQPPRNAR